MGEGEQPADEESALVVSGSKRAASALENAGELRAAARLFEYVGEHGQAAALRLEHAATVRNDDERLSILREGAARIGGRSPEGRELHRALARTLVERAAALPPGARRRSIVLEAAQSYEVAQEGERAGQIYERLGLLRRAERAYRDAGALGPYERVLEALEDKERAARDLRQLQETIDEALREGRRRQARELMRDHVATRRAAGRPPRAHLVRELAELERRTPRDGQVELRYRGEGSLRDGREGSLRDGREGSLRVGGEGSLGAEGQTRLVVAPQLRVGRAPGLELVLDAPAVSRQHLVLRLGSEAGGRLHIHAEDLGSKAGSFFDGEAMLPGDPLPLDYQGELAVGIAATWSWFPGPSSHAPSGLLGPLGTHGAGEIERRGEEHWLLFAPGGAALELAPGLRVPATVQPAGEFVELVADDNCAVELQGRPLGPGATVELLCDDRIELRFDGARLRLDVLGQAVTT